MIRLVQGVDRKYFPKEIDAMHRNSAAVFAERLGWDVEVVYGWEIDAFDEANPLYLISLDNHTGEYRGSTRLLPTTGPNMLRDVFSCLLDEEETIESATIWEGTRFCVDINNTSERMSNILAYTSAEILCGICEIGLLAGLTHYVAVYDGRMARIFDRVQGQPEILGTPRQIGKVMTYAGFFEVSEDLLARVRSASGITESVLENATFLRGAVAA